MSKFPFTILLLLAIFDAHAQGQWHKGNLHTHSFWSDGDEYPEMIMDWYKSHGYHFVALSDHNILAEGEKWIRVPKSKMYEDGFQNYLSKYGKEWVTFKEDTGRMHVKLKTLAEYRKKFEDKNFLIIQAEEITTQIDGRPLHLNATNVQKLIKPQIASLIPDILQRNIDEVMRQRKETGVPMIVHINHPNFRWGIHLQDMIQLRDERFFEVYNGHPLVNNYGDSTRMGTEQMWDAINIAYANRNQPLMYGLATDDSHNYHQFGAAYSNAGRGWIMVRSSSLTPASLIEAMEAGDFYASTGVTLDDVRVEKNKYSLTVKGESSVTYKIEFIGARKNDKKASVLKTVNGLTASIDISPDYIFVRARITSSKLKVNPFQEGDFEMAWTQPGTRR